jgi:hypothetical protein
MRVESMNSGCQLPDITLRDDHLSVLALQIVGLEP